MKNNINEHDMTKEMLNKMRFGLNENIEDIDDQPQKLTGQVLKDEEGDFKESVTPHATFNDFEIYPKARNAKFSGRITNYNIDWEFSLADANGVHISADNIEMSRDVLQVIQQLNGYYKTWSDEWAEKIGEYLENDNEEENLV